jgi:hypothetical protein
MQDDQCKTWVFPRAGTNKKRAAMMKKANVSRLWQSLPNNLASRLEECITGSRCRGPANTPALIFFRADDIGAPGKQFTRLIELFKHHQAPLSLAVVPAWLTPKRWEAFMKICGHTPTLWCWHQHGWRHQNHENELKKQEFGPSRKSTEIEYDLTRGRERLSTIMKKHFYPAFTPPWNRCSQETLALLARFNYRAVSRSQDARPISPGGLPDIPVNVDLHTRRETRSEDGWKNLLEELRAAITGRFCGIMIHHQRMNDAAFVFMDLLLDYLRRTDGCRIVGMPEVSKISSGKS